MDYIETTYYIQKYIRLILIHLRKVAEKGKKEKKRSAFCKYPWGKAAADHGTHYLCPLFIHLLHPKECHREGKHVEHS